MPVYDPLLGRLVVRIVYDGPAFSGKTTNVKRICELFPVQRRSEMVTPGALKGRTMFFDWLEIDVGRIGPYPIRAQILSVPGQRQRSYRRRPLIQSADTLVFVADGAPSQLAETRRCFALMKRYIRERGAPAPLVVQANKQDAEGALRPDDLRATLRIAEDVDVLPAVAAHGQGVRDTLMAAVKLAVRQAHQLVLEVGIAGIEGQPDTADTLFDLMLTLEDDADPGAGPEEPAEEEIQMELEVDLWA